MSRLVSSPESARMNPIVLGSVAACLPFWGLNLRAPPRCSLSRARESDCIGAARAGAACVCALARRGLSRACRFGERLKNMPGSKNDSGDDDASSMHSFGSCTDADEEDSVLSTSSSFSNTSRRALASRLSGQSPAHVIPPASAQKSSSERHYAPMASTERAKRSGEAEAAIEAQWEQAEGKLRDAQDNTALRGEIEQLKATLKHARKDAKYLRERMEQMAAENRVLRRDPRKGKRDAVIEQLEVELQRKEQVRAALAADACARRRR
uniref:Uncharacterized protein n=1 Tax=Chrysotila carterae TaxID=13221 RepID=A0A7S4EX97_CHRCT